MNKNGEGLWLALVYRINKKRSALHQPLQHATMANAAHCGIWPIILRNEEERGKLNPTPASLSVKTAS